MKQEKGFKILGDIINLPEMKSINGTQASGMRKAYENIGFNEAIKKISNIKVYGYVLCSRCGMVYLLIKKTQMELDICPKCERIVELELNNEN